MEVAKPVVEDADAHARCLSLPQTGSGIAALKRFNGDHMIDGVEMSSGPSRDTPEERRAAVLPFFWNEIIFTTSNRPAMGFPTPKSLVLAAPP